MENRTMMRPLDFRPDRPPLLGAIMVVVLAACDGRPDTSIFSGPLGDASALEDAVEPSDSAAAEEIEDAAEPTDVPRDAATAPDGAQQDVREVAEVATTDVLDVITDTDADTVGACVPPCSNGGICEELEGLCECVGGYTGVACEIPPPLCTPSCGRGGTCNTANECDCAAGWEGSTCDVPICEVACGANQICVAPDECRCGPAWMGPDCRQAAPEVVRVRGGDYLAGSPSRELGRMPLFEAQVAVRLTRELLVSRTEFTQGHWKAVMNNVLPPGPTGGTDTLPVAMVTWWSAIEAANALSVQQGLRECYELAEELDCEDLAGNSAPVDLARAIARGELQCLEATLLEIGADSGDVQDCEGWRLPTEAEWEFVARGRLTSAIHDENGGPAELSGATEVLECPDAVQPTLDVIAWWCGNSSGKYQAVAGQKPNPNGLYDVLGNVWEWTWDGFEAARPAGTDPRVDLATTYVDSDGECVGCRSVRGGSAGNTSPRWLRFASRYPRKANEQNAQTGFRLVRTAPTREAAPAR